MGRLISLVFLLLAFVSCENRQQGRQTFHSDTAMVLELAILNGIDDRHMPSATMLTGRSHFHDTILITSKILPLDSLPTKIGAKHFKVLPQKQICNEFARYDTADLTPGYLKLTRFEKSDTGYYVQLQSISCGEYASGGALGMYFRKVKDSLVITNKSSSSIN